MKQFVIDGSRFSTLDEFFAHADEVLCVNFQSGRNLDAFRDVLLGGFGAFEPDEEIGLTWRAAAKSRADLGYPETVRALKKRLQTCHPTNRESVAGFLRDAERGRGPTTYDWLVDSIRGHSHIVFREA